MLILKETFPLARLLVCVRRDKPKCSFTESVRSALMYILAPVCQRVSKSPLSAVKRDLKHNSNKERNISISEALHFKSGTQLEVETYCALFRPPG